MNVRDVIAELLVGHDPSLPCRVKIEFDSSPAETVEILEVKRITGTDPHIAIVVASNTENR